MRVGCTDETTGHRFITFRHTCQGQSITLIFQVLELVV